MELGRWIVRLSHREEFRPEGQQFVEFRRFLVYLGMVRIEIVAHDLRPCTYVKILLEDFDQPKLH